MTEPMVVVVRFQGGLAAYSYFTHLPLAKDDWAVVQIDDLYKVVQVVDTNPEPLFRGRATKWIVDKVDMDVHRMRTALIDSTLPDEKET